MGAYNMDEKTHKAFYNAIDRVNDAYWAEDYDKYEELIERYAKRFSKWGYDYNSFEDSCTDVRMWGHDVC